MRILIDLQGCQTLSRERGIGRYSSGLAEAMARNAGQHEVWLALNGCFPESIPGIRRTFEGWIPKDRIRTFDAPTPVGQLPHENAWRVHAAELLREEFLHRIQADVVHVSSLFEGVADDAVTSVGGLYPGGRTAVTLYDLILLEMPERFLTTDRARMWYYRKLQSLKNAGVLLGISQFSCSEAMTRLGLSEDRVVNISSAVDSRFMRLNVSPDRERDLRQRYGLAKPFLLSVGAADPHKNLDGLIEAFGLLPPQIRCSYQLAIIFGITDHNRERLQGIARRANVNLDEIVFTGRVSDEDLVELYNLAQLYVMPSFIEGFGLPAVEAMACGVPAIGSNRTSIPEAIGRPDALFDPFQPASMAAKISQVLTDRGFRQSLIDHAARHAQSFSWDTTAQRAIAAIEELHARQKPPRSAVAVGLGKPTLAVIVPPRASWRAHENLLAELAVFYELELILDKPVEESPWIAANFPRRSTTWFDTHIERYDRIVHLFENGLIGLSQLEILSRHPGTAIVHEEIAVTGTTFNESSAAADATLRQLVFSADGYAGLLHLENKVPAGNLVADRCLREEIVKRAGGVILLGGAARNIPELATESEPWCMTVTTSPRSTVESGDAIAGSMFDAHLLHEAIEKFAAHHPKLRRMALLEKIAETSQDIPPTDLDLAQVAAAIARQEPNYRRTLYLDISMFALNDNKSGIHRVVRNIVRELVIAPPQGIRVETIREQNGVFWTARSATCSLLAVSPPFPEECVVEFKQGDILLGIDLTADRLPPQRALLAHLRGYGVEIWFTVYDLLPVQRPEWFPPEITSWFGPWLDTATECADGLVCISNAVATEMQQFLDAKPPVNGNRPRIDFFHLGAEIHSNAPGEDYLPADTEAVLQALSDRPSFLMVGTLEPRKGHEIVLVAFERLWKDGEDINLVIVGPQGWKVETLVKKLNAHPERGRRLYWLGRISDAYLNRVYDASAALIAASLGEGFGLPIVEAALHAKPVIASDIPVFREVAGATSTVLFFRKGSAEDLSEAVRKWLNRTSELEPSTAGGGHWLTWAESARQILRAVLCADGSDILALPFVSHRSKHGNE